MNDFAGVTSAFLVAVAAGMSRVIGQPASYRTGSSHRNALAVICSITWAFTLLGLRYVQRDQPATSVGLSAVTLEPASLAAWPFAWPFPLGGCRGVGDDVYSACVRWR